MSYLDESGLSTYDSNLKEWISSQESKTITSSIYPWAKTAKAGAVSCYPVGGTELKPVVNFLFTETPPASGSKGPTNPSAITGVSSVKVTRCEKNLVNLGDLFVRPGRGIAASQTADGAVSITGTTTGSGFIFFNSVGAAAKKMPSCIKNGKTYTFSFNTTYANCVLQVFFLSSLTASWGSPTLELSPNTSGTLTINSNWLRGFIRIYIPTGNTTNFKAYVQVEEDSTATSFEPYTGTDYTIALGDTYYGGSIDLVTGIMTVTHGIKVLNGTESWKRIASSTETISNFQATIASLFGCTGVACSHYVLYSLGITENYFRIYSDGYLRIGGLSATTYPDKDAFESWLAAQYVNGTPVTVVYELATPQTVQLSTTSILALAQTDKYTPRLNTIYSDQTAVQVGYVKSPIRKEYELTQAIVAQGGNI